MDIRERLLKLIEVTNKKPKELEQLTGIDRMSWSNLKRRMIRVHGEHIEAAAALWPEYAYWLVTGKTQPEVGNIGLEPCEKKCLTKQLAEKVSKTLKNGPGSPPGDRNDPLE